MGCGVTALRGHGLAYLFDDFTSQLFSRRSSQETGVVSTGQCPVDETFLSNQHGEELSKLNRSCLFENLRIISQAKSLRSAFPRGPVEVRQHPALRIRSLDELLSGLRQEGWVHHQVPRCGLTRRITPGKCKAGSFENWKEGRESISRVPSDWACRAVIERSRR